MCAAGVACAPWSRRLSGEAAPPAQRVAGTAGAPERAAASASSESVVRARLALWASEAARQAAERASRAPLAGVVALQGGASCHVDLARTSAAQLPGVAERLAAGGDGAPVIARVNRELLWDLTRPLGELPVAQRAGGAVCLEVLGFDSAEGQEVWWHSTAHLLGHALEREFGADRAFLCDGPALPAPRSGAGLVGPGSGGFFYDVEFAEPTPVTPERLKSVGALLPKSFKGVSPFERLELSPSVARAMFAANPRKLAMIDALLARPDVVLSAYRCGDFVDLCRGPHVPSAAGLLRGGGVKVLSASSVSGTGAGAPEQRRVYGISFPSKELLKDWESRTAEAVKRNHRVVGKRQGLFMFHDVSPGCAFLLPHGALVYNKLLAMLRDQYTLRGYEEVMTPLMYGAELWKKSGHWDNYRDNMYQVESAAAARPALDKNSSHGAQDAQSAQGAQAQEEQGLMGLKPMNCPGHCLIYAASNRSFRDLPVRLADFSALHRNEVSGSLGGMTRLRRFQQDDAHIFCLPEQIHAEIVDVLAFLRHVYKGLFDFEFVLRLSTRDPNKFIGEVQEWEDAEAQLRSVLDGTGMPWTVDPGEAAFYGPKIDCAITDALGRQHQCATIQLDFQLPKRFDLEYTSSGGEKKRPVMIHRAILGSVERFMAILLEHTNGRLPFWLSPRQVTLLPVSDHQAPLAHELAKLLRACCLDAQSPAFMSSTAAAGLCVTVDDSNESLAKRVRNAQQAPFNVIAVVGQDEAASKTLSLRSNDGATIKTLPVDEVLRLLAHAVKSRTNTLFPL